MATNKETVVIEGTLYWPNLNKVNQMSGKYQVDIGNLGKEAINTIKNLGVSVKTDQPKKDNPDKGQFVTAKSNYPISVVFKTGVEQVDPSEIGNGTQAKVKVNPYSWTFRSNSGVSLGALKIQVTELSKYEQADSFDDDDDVDDVDDDIDDGLSDDFTDN